MIGDSEKKKKWSGAIFSRDVSCGELFDRPAAGGEEGADVKIFPPRDNAASLEKRN